ncbi:MAG: Gfo/Idh/MocA family protein [Pseudohongiellaceae bacterium]
MKFPDYSENPIRFFDNPAAQRNFAKNHKPASGMAASKYKINIIGCGMIGREHMSVASLLGLAAVNGVFDVEKESIAKAKQEFASYASHQLHVYESLEEACFDEAVDALFICTPNFTHFEILQTALKSGKGIFVEKPMATDLSEAAELVALAETYSNFIQLGMQYRYKSQYSQAFCLVKKQQSLGEVKTISMSEYRPPFLDKVEQWNKFNENSGGTLVEKCCHYFDLINMMAESIPVKVFATGGQAVNFIDFVHDGKSSDIDDHAFVIIEYANGVKANFTLNMFCPELEEELVVVGDKGRLTAAEKSSFVEGRNSKATLSLEVDSLTGAEDFDLTYAPLVERSGHHGATFFEHMALIEKLDGGEPDSATPLQGLWALIVASAAQESIRIGMPVLIKDYLNTLNIKER